MPTTPNLGLVNVLESENFDIDVINGNNDKVDEFAGSQPKKTTLFENANGSNSTIALNDSAANYNYIEVTFLTDEGTTQLENASNGKKVSISQQLLTGTTIITKIALINISGTSISWSSNLQTYQTTSAFNIDKVTKPYLITKVVGVKGF